MGLYFAYAVAIIILLGFICCIGFIAWGLYNKFVVEKKLKDGRSPVIAEIIGIQNNKGEDILAKYRAVKPENSDLDVLEFCEDLMYTRMRHQSAPSYSAELVCKYRDIVFQGTRASVFDCETIAYIIENDIKRIPIYFDPDKPAHFMLSLDDLHIPGEI